MGDGSKAVGDQRRRLPSVDVLLRDAAIQPLLQRNGRFLVLAAARGQTRSGPDELGRRAGSTNNRSPHRSLRRSLAANASSRRCAEYFTHTLRTP